METSHGRWRTGLGVLALVALVLLVYRPLLPGSFLMDDRRLVQTDNPLVNGTAGPLSIWFRADFALSTFACWAEWLAWGQNPGGYHAVNMALHALSAVLVWRLLARLKIPGAWLAAAIFAVHPVGVATVGRIAELKNTLSLPFFLLSIYWYLRYEGALLSPSGGALWLGCSLAAFILALLAKTSTVMLPSLLLACAVWQRERVTRQDMLRASPLLPWWHCALGGCRSGFRNTRPLAGVALAPQSFWERLAVAGHVFSGFTSARRCGPSILNLVYPQWKVGCQPR